MSLYTSLLTAGTNSHQETSENANAVATDVINPGIVGSFTSTSGVAPMTGGFSVNAQGTPAMSVAVSTGICYVAATPTSQNSQTLRVRNSTTTNVTISANSSGSAKYDFLYVSIDASKAANPAVNADDVATLVVSRSSSSTSDNGTPPSFGTLLAVITVANGASSITNGNIADRRTKISSLISLPAQNLSNPYKFSAYAGTASSLATSAFSKVAFNTEEYDPSNNYDNTTNYRYTAPVSGYYKFNANVEITAGGAGETYALSLYKNGSAFKNGQKVITGGSGTVWLSVGPPPVFLNSGDYVEVWAYNGTGGGKTASSGQTITYFGGYLVSVS